MIFEIFQTHFEQLWDFLGDYGECTRSFLKISSFALTFIRFLDSVWSFQKFVQALQDFFIDSKDFGFFWRLKISQKYYIFEIFGKFSEI